MRRSSLLLALVLASCLGPLRDDDDAAVVPDTGPPLPLAPGVVRMPCTETVRTVAVDGDRVVVLTRGGVVDRERGDAVLCISDDRARTFRVTTIPEASLDGLETYRLHVRGSDAWLLLADQLFARTLLRASTVVARRMDLATGTLEAPVTLDVATYHFGDDAIVGFHRTGMAGGADRSAAFVRLDLASGEVTRTSAPAPGGDCPEPPLGRAYASADGDTFVRACYRQTELCVQRARRSGPSFDEACTTYPAWPIPWEDPQEDVLIDGAVRHLRSGGGRLFAAPLLATGASGIGAEVDVGQTVAFAPVQGPVAGLLDLVDASHDPTFGLPYHRLVTLRGGALVPIVVPESACTGAVPPPECGDEGEIVASFGDGAWLVSYGLSLLLEVREGEGTPGPFVVPSELPEGVGGDWIAMQPADTPLERMCAFAASCPGGAGVPPSRCIEYWERMRGPAAQPSGGDAQYARFLATPMGDCAALADSFPAAFGACPRCTPDGRAVSCTDGEAIDHGNYRFVRDCAAEGATCSTSGTSAGCTLAGATCDTCDATGHAVTCASSRPLDVADCAARGLTCDATNGPHCFETLPAGAFGACDGTVWTTPATPPGPLFDRLDCARGHLPCRPPYGCSWDGVHGTGCAPGGAICQGDLLTWEICGFTRFVDCLSLGAIGCSGSACTFP